MGIINKPKYFFPIVLSIVAVFGLLFILSFSSAATLSKSLFPQTLAGYPLIDVEEVTEESEKTGYGIREHYEARYSDRETEEIAVSLIMLESEKKLKEVLPEIISSSKEFFISEYGGEAETTYSKDVYGYLAKYFRSTTDEEYWESYWKNDLNLFVPVSNFLIRIAISRDDTPSLDQAEQIAKQFIDRLPIEKPPPPPVEKKNDGEGCSAASECKGNYCVHKKCRSASTFCGDKECDSGETYENCSKDCEKPKPVCGNNNCEEWLGEQCANCPKDCSLENTCCKPEHLFLYPNEYQNKIYNPHPAYGGVIVDGAFILPPGTKEKNFFENYSPKMCIKGKIVNGECAENWHCPKGVCANYKCVEMVSKDFKIIEDEEISEKVYEDQTVYKTKYVDAYRKAEGNIASSAEKEGLNIKLEVQGNTAGKVQEVNKGDEIEVRLEIENVSNRWTAVVAGIIYPGSQFGTFMLDEKKYTMGFGWSDQGVLNWGSLSGSYQTILSGGRAVVLPARAKTYIYSKVVPQQTGYLDIQGIVFSSYEKKFTQPEPDFIRYNLCPSGDMFIYDIYEKERKPEEYEKKLKSELTKTEIVRTILVTEKKCGWFSCLW